MASGKHGRRGHPVLDDHRVWAARHQPWNRDLQFVENPFTTEDDSMKDQPLSRSRTRTAVFDGVRICSPLRGRASFRLAPSPPSMKASGARFHGRGRRAGDEGAIRRHRRIAGATNEATCLHFRSNRRLWIQHQTYRVTPPRPYETC